MRDGQNNMFTELWFSNTTAQPALSLRGFVLSGSSASTRESFHISRFSSDVMINRKITMTDSKHKSKTLEPNCDCVQSVFFSVSGLRHTLCGPTRPPSPFWGPDKRSWWTEPFRGCNRWTGGGSAYPKMHCSTELFFRKKMRDRERERGWQGLLMTKPDAYQILQLN